MKTKYFACSDIHGFYDEWMIALKQSGFDICNDNHKIIVCGDLLDRGHQPKEIIDFILSNKDKFILIKGNHEELLEDMIKRNYNTHSDISNGTTGTIIDLCPEWQITKFDLKEIFKQTRLNEIYKLFIDYFETSNHIFIHAWIPINQENLTYDSNWRNANKKAWESARWANTPTMVKNNLFEPNKTIVCGHWHTSAFWHMTNPDKYCEFGPTAKFDPFISKEVIALDACTPISKKINVLIIEE